MTLLPALSISNTIDAYIDKHPTNSQKIYWVVLISLTAAFISLPFVYVNVSVQDPGIIRPVAEKTELKACISEFVDSIYTKEGDKLKRGDTLLTFRTSNPNYKIHYQQGRINDYQAHLDDLHFLAKGIRPTVFHSDVRRQEYVFFTKQRQEYETNRLKAAKDYERNQTLFMKSVISEEEYEQYQYAYDKANNELASLIDNQTSKWQTDLNTYQNSFDEIQSAMKQEIKRKDLYVVTSPVNGTLDQFHGIYKGCNIQAGSSLAVISPDSTLYIEAYVSPRNIGYIHVNMPVNIQIESFNYNEWGTISGQVIEVSSDFLTDNSNNAYYKVKYSMNKNYLTRKNGIKGTLKKGMNIVCHFMITRRSLFDLLYQKADDWANPTQYNKNTVAQSL